MWAPSLDLGNVRRYLYIALLVVIAIGEHAPPCLINKADFSRQVNLRVQTPKPSNVLEKYAALLDVGVHYYNITHLSLLVSTKLKVFASLYGQHPLGTTV